MKIHTNQFKENVKLFGRELDSIITYEINGEKIELGAEELNSITPHYESNILKSAMKQLDIDSNVEIPLNTIINYQFGIKVRDDNVEDYRDNYDYINYGNYIVYSNERQEDTNSYKIICYDKMLYTMVDYESIGITYPITIRNYINKICQYLGLTFKNINDNFVNYNKEIPFELYLAYNEDTETWDSLGYTFRDVFDELAQVTASTICINEEDDELEIRYINNTNDVIDEEYLKDVNINFGEKYGPINSIVLSRSAESDNVYLQDEQSIEENGLCEIKIVDNQIMNRNDRSSYLNDILSKLNRLEYYLNDYSSTGICYYNICDRYGIQIGEEIYSCIMFNDEVSINQGLTENIYTDMPEESKTDYTKADKTDRKINQTYIIVDKQNQIIESVVSNVTEQNNKISRISQTVDELNSKISDIADITISGESEYATVDLDNINLSEPIMIKIHPNQTNISYLYPRYNLYPSNNLYMPNRIIRFYNKTTDENIDYVLPDDLLFLNSNIYDEFYLDYDSQTCQVTKRCGYNNDGTVYALSNEVINTYPFPTIILTDGDYTISLLGYETAYVFVRLMAQNIYTTQFATKVEVNTAITQTAQEINLEVNKKVNEDEIISKINLSSEEAIINANKISLAGKEINLTGDNTVITSTNFSVDNQGNMTCNNGNFKGSITGSTFKFGDIVLERKGSEEFGMLTCNSYNASGSTYLGRTFIDGNNIVMNGPTNTVLMRIQQDEGSIGMFILGEIRARGFINTSKAEEKKSIKKFEGALNLINNSDIYSYNWKTEKNTDKKHYGLVIGEGFKTPEQFITSNGEGIDTYSTLSICLQAIKEQQEEIEKLKEEIKLLKEE